mgnify:CR=1 FL=1
MILTVTSGVPRRLVANGVDLLIDSTSCGVSEARCRALAAASLVLVSMYTLLGWIILIQFTYCYRKTCWKGAAPPDGVNAIKDPFFRLLSRLRLRSRALAAPYRHAVTDRARGKFGKPKEWTAEPDRTERLLNPNGWGLLGHYTQLYHGNAADFLDAYQFPLFPMGSGGSPISPFMNHYVMTTQLGIGALSGWGRHITVGTAFATFQVAATMTLQFCLGVYLLILYPTCDKADSFMIGWQFCVESLRTGLLLVQFQLPDAASELRQCSFIISLLALSVPLLRKGYDAIIVQLITLHRGGKLNRRAAGLAMVMFCTALAGAIMKLAGFEGKADAGSAAGATDTAAKLAKRTADQGMIIEIMSAVADVSNDIFALNAQRATPEEHKAATKMQSAARGALSRKRIFDSIDKWRARHMEAPVDPVESRAGLEWLVREMGPSEYVARRTRWKELPAGYPPMSTPMDVQVRSDITSPFDVEVWHRGTDPMPSNASNHPAALVRHK